MVASASSYTPSPVSFRFATLRLQLGEYCPLKREIKVVQPGIYPSLLPLNLSLKGLVSHEFRTQLTLAFFLDYQILKHGSQNPTNSSDFSKSPHFLNLVRVSSISQISRKYFTRLFAKSSRINFLSWSPESICHQETKIKD